MPDVSLEQAKLIAEAALAQGRELVCDPLTVVVLDGGGHFKAVLREDGSGLMRVEIALGKSWGALGMGFASRELARRAEKMPVFFGALAAMSGGRMVALPGGVLIRSAQGELMGSVGVSGDTSDRDEECAVAGVRAAGLSPDIGG
jgi:uncharacterized protein GlcG (DUF336 family)